MPKLLWWLRYLFDWPFFIIFCVKSFVLYQKENFIKAKGNIDITNPDGTHLTSDEAEYDGNTRKAIAKGNVVLTDPKQTIKTETLYYDRNANTAYFNDGGVINVHQDNSVITTKIGTYYVNEQRIVFDSNYRIVNDEYITDGKNVNYLRGEGIAVFNGPTTVTNKKNPSKWVTVVKWVKNIFNFDHFWVTTKRQTYEKQSFWV